MPLVHPQIRAKFFFQIEVKHVTEDIIHFMRICTYLIISIKSYWINTFLEFMKKIDNAYHVTFGVSQT